MKGNRCRRQGRGVYVLYGGGAGDVRRKDGGQGVRGGRQEVRRAGVGCQGPREGRGVDSRRREGKKKGGRAVILITFFRK